MDAHTPSRVLLVGTGLIGGSVGLALRARGWGGVVGYDADPARARAALDRGALDEVAPSLDAAAGVELVVVATPVGEVAEAVRQVARSARAGTVVTDVGSTKAAIVSEAERALGPQRPFVGGHPMAGTEGEGIEASRADLFEGALWILTPTSRTSSEAYRRVNAFVTSLGARTLALDPLTHDRLVALVSHLPYALATTLMALAGEEEDPRAFHAAAGSFRDLTRTAGSNPRIWRDIFRTNREAFLVQLDRYLSVLGRWRDALERADWEALDAMVAAARVARRRFPPKGERAPAEPVRIEVAVPDRTGVLAEVTTAVGGAGINIEDLWVDHTPAGGVLHLLVDGQDAAQRAVRLLADRGFHALVGEEP